MDRIGDLVLDPMLDLVGSLGIRLEFLVPTVAMVSMGAGILVARFSHRSR